MHTQKNPESAPPPAPHGDAGGSTYRPPWGRSMRPSFDPLLGFFLRRIISHVALDPAALDQLRSQLNQKTTVYVMPSASLLDYLLMNMIAIQQDLPLARFCNVIPMALFQPLRGFLRAAWERFLAYLLSPSSRIRQEAQYTVEALRHGQSVLLFLKRPGMFSQRTKWHVVVWEEIIRAQQEEAGRGTFEVQFVPITFVWGRRPGRLKRTLADVLFGDRSAPSYFRKALIFLRNYKNLAIRFREPVQLNRFLSSVEQARDEVQAKKLR